MGDTGLLVTQIMKNQDEADEDLYKALIIDNLGINQGMIIENMVAQMLRASGHGLYFHEYMYRPDENDKENKYEIDFIIITGSTVYLLECKNLYGNIEINSSGDFIRTLYENGKYRKEGIYSPITQNQRHLKVLKDMRLADISNPIQKVLFSKMFENNYKSLVVLTNPKTVVNMKYAKKEIKEQVVRADQLVEYIRNREKNLDRVLSDDELNKFGQYFLKRNLKLYLHYCFENYKAILILHYWDMTFFICFFSFSCSYSFF